MAVVTLSSVQNVRDLGGIPTTDGRTVRSGLLYRGSVLFEPCAADIEELFTVRRIGCIIDLRTGWEREKRPDISYPGVENLHIPFYDLEKVGIEYTEPAKGTQTVGKDLACDPDHYYRSLTNPLTARQMRMALEVLFSRARAGIPVYFHCSGGKDRAGVLAFLALTIIGAPQEAIIEDYLLTNVAREANIQAMYERFYSFCHDEETAWQLTHAHAARTENLTALVESAQERYGSFEAFLTEVLGFDEAARASARDACLEFVGEQSPSIRKIS